jgi:hypothetical protein
VGQDVTVAKTLTVFLAADVSKLSRGLKSAEVDMQGFSGTLNKLVGPALLATVAAAGALAIKLGVDGVQAAIDDDRALQGLAKTLQNVGLAHDTEQIEAYISSLERSLGIADDELRPAYDRLVRSIGDTEQANAALALSLDISAGSGKSLDAVVQALGRAYDGNVAGLSRLGAGIDAATLKTGDMEQITAALSATFAGQAQTAAGTYEGQVKRLSIAADNMKEAFGTGLLKNLGDTDAATQRLVDRMGTFEIVLEDVGAFVGDLALGLESLASETANLGDVQTVAEKQGIKLRDQTQSLTAAFFSAEDPVVGLGVVLQTLVTNQGRTVRSSEAATEATRLLESGYRAATGATEEFTRASYDTAEGLRVSYNAFIKMAEVTANTTRTTADQAERTATATTRMTQYAASVTSASSATQKLNTDLQETSPAYDAATKRVQLATDALDAETRSLDAATQKRKDYVNSLVGQITAGFDLGSGFAMKDGQVDGAAWVAGVEGQLAQTEWFGNVLEAVKRSDATNGEALAQYLAKQGIDKGAVWGQALLDQGLVPTMAAKLQQAVDSAALVATAMADPFTEAGDMAAINTIDGLSKTLATEKESLRQIGKNIGKPIGARIKEEIADAVAQAIREAAAARTAALAEVAAREAAQNAIAVEQATAQSLARLIRNSDNRAGRNVQPVLT